MYAGKANIFNVSLAYTLKIALGRNSAVIRIKNCRNYGLY